MVDFLRPVPGRASPRLPRARAPRSTRWIGAGGLVAFAALAGCGGTDVGNGAAAVEVDVRGYVQGSQPKSLTGNDGTRIDELWLAFDRVRLRPGAVCDGADVALDAAGPIVSDLVGSGVLGGPLRFDTLPGPFCELRVAIDRLVPGSGPAGTPPDLAGLSIVVRGARADGAAFTVRSDLTEELRLGNGAGNFLLPSGSDPLLLAFELNGWITALDLDALGPGPIEVSQTSNPAALQDFNDAVKEAAHLLRDVNGDGEVGSDDVENELAH